MRSQLEIKKDQPLKLKPLEPIYQRSIVLTALIVIGLSTLVEYTLGQQHQQPPTKSTSTRGEPHRMAATPPKPKRTVATPRSYAELREAISPNMFSAPIPETPPSPPQPAARPHLPPPPPAAIVRDPLADYTYTGTVSVNGEISALIEQRASKQGWYVKEGDRWQNYRILSITEDAITLQAGDGVHTLTKSDAINVVPLDAPPAKPAEVTQNLSTVGDGATARDTAAHDAASESKAGMPATKPQQPFDGNRVAFSANTRDDRPAEPDRGANAAATSPTTRAESEMQTGQSDSNSPPQTIVYVVHDTANSFQTQSQ